MRRFIILLAILISQPLFASDKIVVLDVGEGLCVLVQHQSEAILIDTGHPGMSARILKRLEKHGVKTLELIVLTHLHPDHAGGYFRLREAFPDATVIHSGHPLPEKISPDLVRWVNEALKKDPRQKQVMAGHHLSWHDYTLSFLWPKAFTSQNLNRHSLVIRIEYKTFTGLLMGDADTVVERSLLKSKALAPVELLVAGHHGASDASSPPFLEHIQPQVSVISVDKDNIRGYPSPNTVSNLRQFSGKLLRTDRDGDICIRFSHENNGFYLGCPW